MITITVTVNGKSSAIDLDASEVSEAIQRDGSIHRYLSSGSRYYIGEEIEKALLRTTEASPSVVDLAACVREGRHIKTQRHSSADCAVQEV